MNKDKLKNLTVRTLSGAVLAAVLFGATLLSPWGYVALLSVIALVGVWEFYNLCIACGYRPQRIFGVIQVATMLILGVAAFRNLILDAYHGDCDEQLAAVESIIFFYMFVSFPMLFICELFRKSERPIANIGVTIMGALYVGVPVVMMLGVPQLLNDNASHWNPMIAICYILIIWANDSFAYLVGMSIGKHRMCERISPKKSWEGFVGGVVAAIGFAVLFGHLLGGNLLLWGIVGAIIAVTGVAGDFVESMFKRSAGVKDSGAIIPGHGGVLDRFDALFISAPFVFVFLMMWYATLR